MKKTFAVLLSLAMVLSLCIPAFAADTYTVTIDKSTEGHTYEAYQIFTGTLSTGETVLSDIKWGSGVTEAGKTALGDAKAKSDTLTTTAAAEAFAKEVVKYLSDTAATSTYDTDAKNYKIEGLSAGYYLIKDSAGSLENTTEGYTAYILKVVGDTTATPKDGSTTAIKKVDDKNDSNTTQDEIEWHDSADHDIGDMIDFKLEVTIADDYAQYESYYLEFHDVEEQGLTFDPDSVKVYIDGALITTGYEVVTDTDDGCTFEVVFANLKAITEATAEAGSTVTVRYQSELNENANLGSMGNVNKMYAEFSNNPNYTQSGSGSSGETDGRGKTEWDYVIIFTYIVEVNKVDENMNALPGATFTLEKFNAKADGTDEYKGVKGNWLALSTVEAEPTTTFTFKGLDDGEYRLTETEAPEQYNKIEPVYFTVTADHDVLWETQAREEVFNSFSGDAESGEIQFTATLTSGTLSTDVVNEKGLVLPETGGFGTTLIYVVGGLLVAAAVVMLITRKRMSVQK